MSLINYSPSMKDVIVISKDGDRIPKSKMLLVDSMKELFFRFKEEHPAVKIGMSKFCSLRPRWCVTSQSPGTLNVCVCIQHQNPKLMLAALNPSLKYRDMLAMLVCSLSDENCMYYQNDTNYRCKNCPNPRDLTEYLQDKVYGAEITYSEWITEDGQTVMKKTIDTADLFVEKLTSILQKLCRHHFVSEEQSKYLKSLKEGLKEGECLILLDFAENYTLLIQDEVQSHHWSGQQATLHNVVVYFLESQILQHKSFCFISDYLPHDVQSVHAFIQVLVPKLKNFISTLHTLLFFSDGGPAHYKNRHNFANLSFFKLDFNGLIAKWFFSGSGHGKNAADGVGGTVKKLARLEAKRRHVTNQMLTPFDLFVWAKKAIPAIEFIYVPAADIEKWTRKLERRLKRAVAIPGTRSFHCYQPTEKLGELRASILSNPVSKLHSQIFTVVPSLYTPITCADLEFNMCVAVEYENAWWLGLITDIMEDTEEATVKFYHQSESMNSIGFYFPAKCDKSTLNVNAIICKLNHEALKRRSKTSKYFDLDSSNWEKISDSYADFSLYWSSFPS